MGMNEIYKYIVNGDPIPLLRARFGRRCVYDSQKAIKGRWSIDLERQHEDRPMLSGPLHLDAYFYMPIPNHITKEKKLTYHKRPHVFRPDLSNLIKFLEDCATGIIFRDDSIIASISARKLYDHITRTEFIITPLTNSEAYGR